MRNDVEISKGVAGGIEHHCIWFGFWKCTIFPASATGTEYYVATDGSDSIQGR